MFTKEVSLDPEELIAAMDQLPVGVWLTDAQGRIVWANHKLCMQLGLEPPQLVGRKPGTLPTLRACDLSQGESSLSVASPGSGEARLLHCITRQLTGQRDGLRSIGCLIDLPYRDRASRQKFSAPEPPSLDPRTGVLSHTAVMRELESQVSRSRRYHNPLAIVIMRTSGGGTDPQSPDSPGADVPAAIGRLLNDKLRWVDIAGEWDDSSFLLVLPETSGEAAQGLADKLAGEVAALPASDADSVSTHGGVRFWIAQWRQGDDAARLVARAELALQGEKVSASGAA